MDKQIKGTTKYMLFSKRKELAEEYEEWVKTSLEDGSKIKDCALSVITFMQIKGFKKIPENAVVLTEEEYGNLVTRPNLHTAIDVFETRKETAEKFAKLVEFHSVSTRDEEGREIFTISALGLKEILHEEFGIPYDEICKEITEGKV